MKDKLIGAVMIAVVGGIVVLGARNKSSTCCPLHAEQAVCATEACAVACDFEKSEKHGCEVADCSTPCDTEKPEKQGCGVSCAN